jgi:acyl carrier protein
MRPRGDWIATPTRNADVGTAFTGSVVSIKRGATDSKIWSEKRRGIMTTEEKLRTIVADQLMVDTSDVTENANLVEDLGADSLDLVELAMNVEESFDLEIADEDAEKWKTYGDVLAYVTNRVK